jgi:hypothetical protein
MSITAIQLIILSFGIGLLVGALVSFYILKRTLKKNLNALSEKFKLPHNVRREHSEIDYKQRKANLLLLADKLRQIEHNIQEIRKSEFNSYLSDLNRLLDRKGISKIDGAD